jgi:hypothetical protein
MPALKTRDTMTLSELAGRAKWFDDLAAVYQKHDMAGTARKFQALAAEYRAEMERRPDTAE